ncbi:hypothetical protein KBB68_00670 [Candidatus Babeliales bacterium]|nr:hypothetical protein [Candidatus Babeliales bacterium]
MRIKLCFLIINLYVLSFSVVCARTNTLDLLNLLQRPVAKKQIDEKPEVKVQEKQLSVESVKKTINVLIDNVEIEQSNANYQDALKILSDSTMRATYHDDMVSIQLFLLDYIMQILQKYSVSVKKIQKSLSLADLLQKIVPTLPTDAQHQLSNLTDLLQKESVSKTAHVVSHIDLEQFLQKIVPVVSAVSKPKVKVNLKKLLKVVPQNSVVHIAKSPEKPDKLLNLLMPG